MKCYKNQLLCVMMMSGAHFCSLFFFLFIFLFSLTFFYSFFFLFIFVSFYFSFLNFISQTAPMMPHCVRGGLGPVHCSKWQKSDENSENNDKNDEILHKMMINVAKSVIYCDFTSILSIYPHICGLRCKNEQKLAILA